MGDRRPETKPRKISLKIEEEEREMEDGSDQGCQCQNQPQQKAIPIPAPANSQSRVGNRIDVPMAAIERAKQLIKQVRKNSMLRESQTKLTFLGTEAAETDNEAKEEQGNENGESGDHGGGVEKQQHKTLVTRL